MIKIKTHGIRRPDQDSWMHWCYYAITPGSEPESAQEALGKIAEFTDHTWYGPIYRGPGKAFCRAPLVRWGPGRILVKQHGGYDV